MQVHWLRVVLDEGQKFVSTSITDRQEMCYKLIADRRWIMTGLSVTSFRDEYKALPNISPKCCLEPVNQ